MIRNPMESTESRAVDSALNRPRRFGHRMSFVSPWRGFVVIATVVVLFYAVSNRFAAHFNLGFNNQ
jgi:hypothetical protein